MPVTGAKKKESAVSVNLVPHTRTLHCSSGIRILLCDPSRVLARRKRIICLRIHFIELFNHLLVSTLRLSFLFATLPPSLPPSLLPPLLFLLPLLLPPEAVEVLAERHRHHQPRLLHPRLPHLEPDLVGARALAFLLLEDQLLPLLKRSRKKRLRKDSTVLKQ